MVLIRSNAVDDSVMEDLDSNGSPPRDKVAKLMNLDFQQ